MEGKGMMGKRALRRFLAMVFALGFVVAAPLHALAMPMPCPQMSASQAADEEPGQHGEHGDMDGPQLMDCLQHCAAVVVLPSPPTPGSSAFASPAVGGPLAFTDVFPEFDPSPPRS